VATLLLRSSYKLNLTVFRWHSGILHIAEVTSRLVSNDGFISLICSFGFELEEHVGPPHFGGTFATSRSPSCTIPDHTHDAFRPLPLCQDLELAAGRCQGPGWVGCEGEERREGAQGLCIQETVMTSAMFRAWTCLEGTRWVCL
jgi:hypothetical protein